MFYTTGSVAGSNLISPDGITWAPRPHIPMSSISYGNGVYVAVSPKSIAYSSDGSIWTDSSSGIFGNMVTFVDGIFVVAGNGGTIYTSVSGHEWVKSVSGTSAGLYHVSLCNDRFYATGLNGTIISSSDGKTWTAHTSGTQDKILSIAYGNNAFVACGQNGLILLSSNSNEWAQISSGICHKHLNSIAFGNDIFVAVGDSGKILSSLDAITWKPEMSGTSADLISAVFCKDRFFVFDSTGTVYTSSDADTWTATRPYTGILNTIAYGNGKFVLAGNNGTILTSTDLETWVSRSRVTGEDLTNLAFGNGTFVASGYNFITSTDGVLWSSIPRETYSMIASLSFGSGRFAAIDNYEYGLIITSDNGKEWEDMRAMDYNRHYSIASGNGQFVIVGDRNSTLTSNNGLDWQCLEYPAATTCLRSVAIGNGMFVAVGENGTILSHESTASAVNGYAGRKTSLAGGTIRSDKSGIKVFLPLTAPSGPFEITVFNVSGQSVYSGTHNNNSRIIDIPSGSIAPGRYVIDVREHRRQFLCSAFVITK
jgi:photosystem II stability/assembly factor-like uncharacterized protein